MVRPAKSYKITGPNARPDTRGSDVSRAPHQHASDTFHRHCFHFSGLRHSVAGRWQRGGRCSHARRYRGARAAHSRACRRQPTAGRWCHGSALGDLSRRHGIGRSADWRRCQGQCRQSSRYHTARNGGAVRRCSSGRHARESRCRCEGARSQRRDHADARGAEWQRGRRQAPHRSRRERECHRAPSWDDRIDVGGRAAEPRRGAGAARRWRGSIDAVRGSRAAAQLHGPARQHACRRGGAEAPPARGGRGPDLRGAARVGIREQHRSRRAAQRVRAGSFASGGRSRHRPGAGSCHCRSGGHSCRRG